MIVHADLDAFFASVEQLDRPELRGRPVLVGGSPEGRGVVAACSYEARVFGIHSAMPMRTALRLCPQAVVLPTRFARYRELSGQVMGLLQGSAEAMEQVSIDEAYLDVTAAWRWERAPAEAAALKARVKEEAGLNISLGVAAGKSTAKIASDLGKPNGLVVVPVGSEAAFLAALPVRRLGGIGPRTVERLARLGVQTLGDLAAQDDRWLLRPLGKRGPELGRMSRGIDDRPVVTEREARSVSAERTFATDVADSAALREAVDTLCLRTGERLAAAGLRGRTVTLKLRLADFTTYTRSRTVGAAIGDAAILTPIAMGLLERELTLGGPRYYRLLGVEVSHFRGEEQLSLFR